MKPKKKPTKAVPAKKTAAKKTEVKKFAPAKKAPKKGALSTPAKKQKLLPSPKSEDYKVRSYKAQCHNTLLNFKTTIRTPHPPVVGRVVLVKYGHDEISGMIIAVIGDTVHILLESTADSHGRIIL